MSLYDQGQKEVLRIRGLAEAALFEMTDSVNGTSVKMSVEKDQPIVSVQDKEGKVLFGLLE
jgi:hypothetical protein